MMEKKFIDSLQEIEEIEKSTPVEEFIPFKSTYEAIYDSAMSHSDKTAISFFLSGDDYKKQHRSHLQRSHQQYNTHS